MVGIARDVVMESSLILWMDGSNRRLERADSLDCSRHPNIQTGPGGLPKEF